MVTPNDMLNQAAGYVLANADRVRDPTFDVGSLTVIKQCLTFHALQGTLRIEWALKSEIESNLSVAGVGIVWQDCRADLLARDARDESAWHWQATNPGGDCLYLALVLTTTPGVLQRLAAWFARRFPSLPELAYRRGRLVESHGLIKRLAGYQKVEIYG